MFSFAENNNLKNKIMIYKNAKFGGRDDVLGVVFGDGDVLMTLSKPSSVGSIAIGFRDATKEELEAEDVNVIVSAKGDDFRTTNPDLLFVFKSPESLTNVIALLKEAEELLLNNTKNEK